MTSAMQQLEGSGLLGNMGAGGGLSGFGAMGGGGGGGGGDMAGMLSQLQGLLGGSAAGGGFGGLGATPPPVADPEMVYATQLQQLQDMGFYDRQANIVALTATGGNVNAAVERLLQ